jgi:hypothetical protein
MRPTLLKVANKVDLSAYSDQNMEIILGYGVYDAKEEHCIFVDGNVRHTGDFVFENVWTLINKIDNKSYAVARGSDDKILPMTFGECQALTAKYGGYVAVPDSANEQSALFRYYVKRGGDAWIGLSRPACDETLVSQSSMGKPVNIPDFSDFAAKSGCYPNQATTIYMQGENGAWNYANANSKKSCIIEIDSPNYKLPYKVCAPWWRIERSFPNIWADQEAEALEASAQDGSPVSGRISNDKLKEMVTRNLPIKLGLCTQIREPSDDCFNTNEDGSRGSMKTSKQLCDTYYDKTLSPICAYNPENELCFVNECKWYAANCQREDSFEPFKNYTKTPSLDGTLNEKQYHKLTVNVYRCPACNYNPSPYPASQDCLQSAQVHVWGQYCDDNQTVVYPNSKSRREYDLNGNLARLIETDVCPNNSPSELVFDIGNDFSVQSKTCAEWEETTVIKKHDYRCQVERDSFEAQHVAGDIGEADSYMSDSNCLRKNTVEEARKSRTYSFSVQRGDTRLLAYQTLLDGTVIPILNVAPSGRIDGLFKYLAEQRKKMGNTTWTNQSNGESEDEDVEAEEKPECKVFNDADFLKRLNGEFLFPHFDDQDPNSDADVSRINSSVPLWMGKKNGAKYLLYANATKADCQQNANHTSGTPIYRVCGAQYDLNATTGYCERRVQKTILGASIDPCVANETPYQGGDICRSEANLTQGTYNDLPLDKFLSVGHNDILNAADTTARRTCIIKSGGTDAADMFEVGWIAGENTYLLTDGTRQFTQEECKKTALCLVGDGTIDAASGKCQILINDNTGEEPDPPANDDDNVTLPTDSRIPAEGALLQFIDANGTASAMGVIYFEEIVEINASGQNYGSTYYSHPVSPAKLSLVSSEEERVYFHPLGYTAPTRFVEELHFYYNHYQQRVRTGKREPLYREAGLEGDTTMFVAGSIVGFPITVVGILWEFSTGYRSYGKWSIDWSIYKDMPEGKVIDGQISDPTDIRERINDTLVYHRLKAYVGMRQASDNEPILKRLTAVKKAVLDQAGYDGDEDGDGIQEIGATAWRYKESIPKKASLTRDLIKPYEKGWAFSQPSRCTCSIKSCKPPTRCRKTKDGTEAGDDPASRITTGFWTDSVNALTILVPYRGEYVVAAYDKWDNKLASLTTTMDGWSQSIAGDIQKYPHYKIQLGRAMTLSGGHPAQPFRSEGSACIDDPMVEWGGGVSGVYYENTTCGKSHDEYVKDHAAVKITVQHVSETRPFTINLTKPMPYANKITLVTFDMSEIREYVCYTGAEQCYPPEEF